MKSLPELAERMRQDLEAGRLGPVESYMAMLPERGLQVAAVHAHFSKPRDAEASDTAPRATRSVIGLETLADPDRTRHTLQDEIARGGMGVVFAARDEILRRDLAIKKVISATVPGSQPGSDAPARVDDLPLLVRRLMEEAQVTAQLDHSGVVPVHDMGVDDDGHVFFTMKRVRGRTLEEVFELVRAGEGDWSLGKALQGFLKICETLAYAHAKGVIHRDLKPANVMVGRYGEIYVMDWGLAKVRGDGARPAPAEDIATPVPRAVVTDQAELAQAEASAGMTQFGSILGTLGYMPPEQAKGNLHVLDERSDLWSLGAMLYELLAGHAPYMDPDSEPGATHVLLRYHAGPPTPLATRAADAPPELVSIVERAMATKPEDRFASAAAMSRDIQAFLDGRVVQSHQTGVWIEVRKWVRRNRLAAAGILAGLLIVAAGISAFVWQKHDAAMRIARQRDAAEDARSRAEGQRLAAQAHLEEPRDPARALELALAAAELAPGQAADKALYASLRHQRLRDELRGHEGYVTQGAFVSNDRLLVTADTAGLVIVWDLEAGEARHWLDTPHGEARALAVGPSGRRVAVAFRSGDVAVWHAEEGTLRARLNTQSRAPITDLHWVADDQVVLACADGRVALWSVGEAREVRELHPSTSGARARTYTAQANPGEAALVLLDSSGTLRLSRSGENDAAWRVAPSVAPQPRRRDRVHPLLFADPQHRHVIVQPVGQSVHVRNWEDGAEVQVLVERGTPVVGGVLGPRGDRLVLVTEITTDTNERARRSLVFDWDAEAKRFTETHRLPSDRGSLPIALSPDTQFLISARGFNATVTYVDTGTEAFPLLGHGYRLRGALASTSGRLMVTLNEDRVVRTWRALLPGEFRGLASSVDKAHKHLARSSDQSLALFLVPQEGDGGRATLLESESGRARWTTEDLGAPITHGILDTDRGQARLLLRGGHIVALDIEDGKVLTRRPLEGVQPDEDPRSAAFSPDGTQIILMRKPPTIHDTSTGRHVRALVGTPRRATSPSWSPNGRRLLISNGPAGTFSIFDAQSGKQTAELRGHGGHALTGAWHPHRPWVATSARDGSVRLWNADTGEQLAAAIDLPMKGSRVAFSHDGQTLVFNSSSVILLRVENPPALTEITRLPSTHSLQRLVFHPDEPHFYTLDRNHGVRTWLLDPQAQGRQSRARGTAASRAEEFTVKAGTPSDPLDALAQASALVTGGEAEAAHEAIDAIEITRPRWARPAVLRAALYVSTGDTEEALLAFEEAVDRGVGELLGSQGLVHDARFKSLHNHERFQDLLKRMLGD